MKFHYAGVLIAAGAMINVASASVFNSHVGINVDNNQLITEDWQSGIGYLGESRVFAFDDMDVDLNFGDIATNSVGGTFAWPGVIGFNIHTPVQIWNGDGFDVSPNTLTVQFGPLSVTTGDGFTAGFGTAVRDPDTHPNNPEQWGRHHVHYDVLLNDHQGLAPVQGIYMIEMGLWYEPGKGNSTMYTDSKPFWVLLNLGASETEVMAASTWVQKNLVPAPSALVLLVLMGATGTRRRPNRNH